MTSSDFKLFEPNEASKKNSLINSFDEYNRLYEESISNPDKFWMEMSHEFIWEKKPVDTNVLRYNFDSRRGPIFINAFKDGVTNICYNILDRHIENGLGDKIAFYWEGNDTMDFNKYTYQYLFDQVCKFANLLKTRGIVKGDTIAIYMPMIIELIISILACSRIGAIHLVIFPGFSAVSLAERIIDGKCKTIITADGSWRGQKLIELKIVSDEAIAICEEKGLTIKHCFVVKHVTNAAVGRSHESPGCRPVKNLLINMMNSRDEWWHDGISHSDMLRPCPVEWMKSEDPLFILYTSGSTGKPKGVLHTTGGYMVYTAITYKYVFDHKDDDVFWCTADLGCITGHSYTLYGPMSQGATLVIFEGVPIYPDPSRIWKIIDKYLVTKLYTTSTVLRTLMKSGDNFVNQSSRASLKLLGSVGEPINPQVWIWLYEVVGGCRCPIVDTYGQTETGGHVITPLPAATPLIPGSVTLPFFGIEAALINESGNEIIGPGEGYLVFKKPWPGIMRSVVGNHKRFENTYFNKHFGYYTTGDGAKRSVDGYYTITGHDDDILKVSGLLLSTVTIESVLLSHPFVVEAAVVGVPHNIKGQGIYCFVTVSTFGKFDDLMKSELVKLVRENIGAIASPDFIQEARALPKTRSGTIIRRLLRQIASNGTEFGDISALMNPSVLKNLFRSEKFHD